MSKKKKKVAPNPTRWISPFSVLFFLALIFCWLIINIPLFNDFKNSKDLRDTQRSQLTKLENEITQLESQKKEFQIGEKEKERVIRERYKMVKKGEKLIQITSKEQ